MANDDALQTTALRKRGRERLMLRMPEHSRALADATGENFLDLCESYELAWAGLNHWSRAPSDRGEQLKEYQDLIGALEAEVLNLIQQFR